jgi:hypothetical protein
VVAALVERRYVSGAAIAGVIADNWKGSTARALYTQRVLCYRAEQPLGAPNVLNMVEVTASIQIAGDIAGHVAVAERAARAVEV